MPQDDSYEKMSKKKGMESKYLYQPYILHALSLTPSHTIVKPNKQMTGFWQCKILKVNLGHMGGDTWG